MSLRTRQLDLRVSELRKLINDILEPKFLKETLGLAGRPVLDPSKLIVSGIRFGGTTAYQLC